MAANRPPDKATQVRAMFGRIAGRYDLMNALMTFGLHDRWRRLTAQAVSAAGAQGLDLGAGTGDLALALAGAGAARVVALDFSRPMLLRARTKVAASPVGPAVRIVAGDALNLPFADDSFDCAVNGFVLRNVADLRRTFDELRRVLRPGGRLACLELTHPPTVVAPIFRPYFERLVPVMGRLVTGDAAAYRYLPDSVHPFPDARRLAAILGEAGFVDVRYRRLALGTVCLHSARRPPASG